MSTYSNANFDWYRHKTTAAAPTVRKGNLSVLATAEFRGGQMVGMPIRRERYVWPNPYNQTNSSVFSRKVFAR